MVIPQEISEKGMKERIARWKQVCETDTHSIQRAISKLAWDLAVYSCVVEIVRVAPTNDRGKLLNGMVMDMLAKGFWANTMLAIRRLADRGPINGPKGVCSLYSLIADAQAARGRLTRRVFVEDIAGLEFDYAAQEERFWEYALAQGAEQAYYVPQDLHYELSKSRHQEFNWLSGTTDATATPDDLIRPEVFDRLLARLSQLDDIVNHAHVSIAHAATEASREGRMLASWKLDEAKAAAKELTQIAALAGRWLCYAGVGGILPTPQFDQFEHLDQQLFQGDAQTLRDVWQAFADDTESWSDIAAEDL